MSLQLIVDTLLMNIARCTVTSNSRRNMQKQTCSPQCSFCILHCFLQAELRWLDLSQCKLTSIQDELTRFPKLQMLYLHANQITKLSDVKKLGRLSGLQKLTLHGNPIAELPHYK